MVGILIFLTVVLGSLVTNHVSRSALRRRGVHARATCVRHEKCSNDKFRIHLEIPDPTGVMVRRELSGYFGTPPLGLGATADIVYDPEKPGNVMFAVDAQAGKWAPILIGVVSVLTTLAALATFG
ncbi:DUF3592 domain-containing protein [Streptomyces sp. NPDC004286]|uniref:DUF3592 domain-containing protein n=1 Tax=Streptomyces sp. NPDC004286 TaxID=3364696 RepID=UPI0036AC4980